MENTYSQTNLLRFWFLENPKLSIPSIAVVVHYLQETNKDNYNNKTEDEKIEYVKLNEEKILLEDLKLEDKRN